ncbi:unnamed protein product, partial [Symbiodinium necroappetens]
VALRAVALRESGVEENLDVDEPQSGLQNGSPVNPVDAASKARSAEMEALQKAQDLERLAAVAELHVMEERDVAIRAESEVAGGRHAIAVGQTPSGSPSEASISPGTAATRATSSTTAATKNAENEDEDVPVQPVLHSTANEAPATTATVASTSATTTTTTLKKDEEVEDDNLPVQPVLVAPPQVDIHQTYPSINYKHGGVHQLPQPLEITPEEYSAPVPVRPVFHTAAEESPVKTTTTTSTTATTVTTEEASSSDEDEDQFWEYTSGAPEETTGKPHVSTGTEHHGMLETSTTAQEVEGDFDDTESEEAEESTSVALEAKPSSVETTTEEVGEAQQTSSTTEVAVSAVITTEELKVEDVVQDVHSTAATSTSEQEEDDEDFTDEDEFGDDGSSSTSGTVTESPSTTRTSPAATTTYKKVDDEDEDMQVKPIVVVPEQVEAHQTTVEELP